MRIDTERLNIEGLVARIAAAVPKADQPGDRAALAALRRALGRSPGAVPEACRVVDPFLPLQVSEREEWAAYVTATVMALHPLHARKSGGRRSAGFGRSVGRIRFRDGAEDAGIERRFLALLSADREQIAVHLRGLIVLLHDRADVEPVDYVQLFRDLLDWDRGDRRVQRDWAAGFWGPEAQEAEGQQASAADSPHAKPSQEREA